MTDLPPTSPPGSEPLLHYPAPTGPPLIDDVAPPPFVAPGASQPLDSGSMPHSPYGTSSERRPWWGLGDVILGFPVFLLAAMVGAIVAIPFVDLDQLTNLEATADLPVALLALSIVFQQIGQTAWPVFVSKWKGLGVVPDWRFAFKPADLGIGLGTAFIGLGLAAAVGLGVTELVNLDDDAAAENTQFLTDAKGTPWLYVFLFAVVVGAPVSEELFFRGLTMRAFEKRWGPIVGVIGSTIVFTLPHYTGAGWAGTAVLFASIGTVGVVLAVAAQISNRLGGPIIAHMLFNAVGAAGALGAFDNMTT